MPFVEAKCTNCGAVLPVDSTRDAWVCGYCNTPFIVEKAIQQFNITNNITAETVVVQGGKEDFEIRSGVLVKYNGSSTNVTIPEGIKAIGPEAFAGLGYLEQVMIPNSVVEITPNAFTGTTSLRTVIMPNELWGKFYSIFPYTEQAKPYLQQDERMRLERKRQDEQRQQDAIKDHDWRAQQIRWEQEKRCMDCGGKFNLLDRCRKCGRKMDDHSYTCAFCGSKLPPPAGSTCEKCGRISLSATTFNQLDGWW